MSELKTPPQLKVKAREGKTREQDMAWVLLDPTIIAACFLADHNKSYPNVDVTAFADEVRQRADAVQRNDLSGGEAMLTAQAHALNSLFYSMANRSAANSKEGYVDSAEVYMKLALRAQSQCRSTWEAIAEIKNPRQVAFVKQANMGQNVQVNNGTPQSPPLSRAKKTEIEPNKLLEANDGERMDTRTQNTTGRANSEVETVGAFDRAKDGNG